MRHLNLIDKVVMQFDGVLNTVFASQPSSRVYPAEKLQEQPLSDAQKRRSQGFMRVNHTGEVCAQALYRGHMVCVRSQKTREMLQAAAIEETDHLSWTHQRLEELDTYRSYLNMMWYSNAFMIGMLAAALGDRWGLAFVVETEKQVSEHLTGHLGELSKDDLRSRAVVTQMREDEEHHGASAEKMGAAVLPEPIKQLMKLHAKVMTSLVYYV